MNHLKFLRQLAHVLLAVLAFSAAAHAQVPDPETFNKTFAHRRARVDGVQLHYVIGGTGDPVVLLHGWLGTWYTWRKVMPLLAQHHTVIVPDVRGYGDSDKPDTGYDARTIGREIRTLVRQLGFDRVFVVGHDMGALPALAYAAEFPDEVRGLVYMDEPLPGYNLQEFLTPTAQNRGGYWHFAFQGVRDLPERLIEGRERDYLNFFFRLMLLDQSKITEVDRTEYERTLAHPGGLRGSFGWYRSIWETSEQFREWGAKGLSVPVLAARGEFGVPRVEEQMRLIAKDVRGATIAGSGHLVPEEGAEKLASELLSFFARAGSPPSGR